MGWTGRRRMARWFLLLSSAIASTSLLVPSAATNYSEPLDISALLNKLAIHSWCPKLCRPQVHFLKNDLSLCTGFKLGTTVGCGPTTEALLLLWGLAFTSSLSARSARSSWISLLTCISGMMDLIHILENLKMFFCQAILERRQVKIWSKGKKSVLQKFSKKTDWPKWKTIVCVKWASLKHFCDKLSDASKF